MLQTIINDAFDAVDSVNPFVEDFDKEKRKMVELLLDHGYNKKQILGLVDVSTNQLKPWLKEEIAIRKKFEKHLKAMKKGKDNSSGY